MLLDELQTYLLDMNLGLTDTNLFAGRLPDTPAEAVTDPIVALFQAPGRPPARTQDEETWAYSQPEVQIVVRGAPQQYEAAEELGKGVVLALEQISNTVLGSTFYLNCLAQMSLEYLSRDVKERPYFGCKFIVMRRDGNG